MELWVKFNDPNSAEGREIENFIAKEVIRDFPGLKI
jgi:hypothetical protein